MSAGWSEFGDASSASGSYATARLRAAIDILLDWLLDGLALGQQERAGEAEEGQSATAASRTGGEGAG